MTYTIDGEQYIAVMAGYGGGPFAYFPVGSAVEKYGNDGRLLVFKLGGGDVPLPDEVEPVGPFPKPPALNATKQQLEVGKVLFSKACSECPLEYEWGIS